MKLQWLDDTDAFYDGCFSYLKAKFPNKKPKILGCEKFTEQPIYNETVVALEQVHHVLRRIEDRSAYTRKDYDDAQGNDDLKIKIINFYKELAFNASDEMANAFQNFAKHYYWDSRIYYYKKFLYSPAGLQDLDFADQKMWTVEKFDASRFFDFLDRYYAFLESSLSADKDELKKLNWINKKIAEQNGIYENLLSSYDHLLTHKIKFGVCLFEVRLPIHLDDAIDIHQSSFSANFLADFGHYMDREFAQDDGVLLVVNHAHVLSLDYVSISFLVIYKIKNYESQEKLVEHYSKRIQSFVGTRSIGQIRVTNCEKMIKKTYPSGHFVGELVEHKQKIDFRDKFLKYFVSSAFLLNVDSENLLKEYSDLYSIFFNDFRYFQEKIYIQPKIPKIPKSLSDQLISNKVLVNDLIDEQIYSNVDKYFYMRDVDPNVIQRIKLIEFLYHQQATVPKTYASLLDDFIRVEKFITHLMFLRRIEVFHTDKQERAFSSNPSFLKLNVLFQQFILISKMNCFLEANYLLREYSLSKNLQFKSIGYQAIDFLKKMRECFPEQIRIDKIQSVQEELKSYQRAVLKDLIKVENEELKKAKKREVSIQTYLELVFKESVIVLRFIFEGGFVTGSEDKAKVFNEMFRDYIENLKRRHTAGVKLIDHVGLYVPYRSENYIDATLFFKKDIKQEVNSADLIKAVSEYWCNYVDRKTEQIHKYNSKRENNKSGINPFDAFKDETLSAKSVKVIQTEGELHDEYLEVYPNQKRNKQYLIQTISKFYAYATLILIDEADLPLMPRKDSLILGRKRISQIIAPPKDKDKPAKTIKQASNAVENYGCSKKFALESVEHSCTSSIDNINEIQIDMSYLKQIGGEDAGNTSIDGANSSSDLVESEFDPVKPSLEEDERKQIVKAVIVKSKKKKSLKAVPIYNKWR